MYSALAFSPQTLIEQTPESIPKGPGRAMYLLSILRHAIISVALADIKLVPVSISDTIPAHGAQVRR